MQDMQQTVETKLKAYRAQQKTYQDAVDRWLENRMQPSPVPGAADRKDGISGEEGYSVMPSIARPTVLLKVSVITNRVAVQIKVACAKMTQLSHL